MPKPICLITGASQGIGEALALEFSNQNHHLILCSRNRENLNRVKAIIESKGGTADIIPVDMAEASSVENLAARVTSSYPDGIDILINNAGTETVGLFEEQNFTDIRRMIDINFTHLIYFSQLMIPFLLKAKKPCIIANNASIAMIGFPLLAPYCATKGAVTSFSDSLRKELRETNISVVNLITPGIQTRMGDDIAMVLARHYPSVTHHMTSPQEYAKKAYKAIIRKKKNWSYKEGFILWWVHRLCPFLLDWRVKRFKRKR